NSVTLGEASITAFGNNFDEDSSCGANLHDTFANLFRPLDLSATPAYTPIWQSGVIDAAISCKDLGAATVATDKQATPRPQGGACDLGAIEADYVFVDGFGG